MENKNLLIGAGVIVVGYLLWKKSQNNSVANSNVITPQYSKECYDELKMRLQQKDVKEPDFEKTFLEKCRKTELKKGVVTPKANEIQRDELGYPQVKRPMGLAMPLNPDFELGLKVGKLPDEFVIKSNGFNTRYYQVRGMFGSTVYMQSYRTDGSIGSSPPMKISNEEFLKAYDVFLQQPK